MKKKLFFSALAFVAVATFGTYKVTHTAAADPFDPMTAKVAAADPFDPMAVTEPVPA